MIRADTIAAKGIRQHVCAARTALFRDDAKLFQVDESQIVSSPRANLYMPEFSGELWRTAEAYTRVYTHKEKLSRERGVGNYHIDGGSEFHSAAGGYISVINCKSLFYITFRIIQQGN